MSGPDLEQIKTFWQKPEGTTGKVVVGAVTIGGAGLVYNYLPGILEWTTRVLEDSLYAGCLAGGLVVLTSPLWNKTMNNLTTNVFRSCMRGLTSVYAETDPIGILANFAEDARAEIGKTDKKLDVLQGHIDGLAKLIKENLEEAKRCFAIAGAAAKQNKAAAFRTNAKQKDRLEQSNVNLQSLLTKLEALQRLLQKLRDYADEKATDIENDVKVKRKERAALLAGYGAFASIVKSLTASPEKRALYDQATEFLAADYAQKIGEIKGFMTRSRGFIESIDLANGVIEENMLDQLTQEMEQKFRIDVSGGAPDGAPPTLAFRMPAEASTMDDDLAALYGSVPPPDVKRATTDPNRK